MLFNSLHFLIFFPIVLGIYYLMPQKIRTYWLLAASYYFYMCWNVKYVLLLLFSTIVTYVSGLAMAKGSQDEKGILHKKLCVAVSFILNLSILFLFKYLDFVIVSLNQILSGGGICILNSMPRRLTCFFQWAFLFIPFRHWGIPWMFIEARFMLKRISSGMRSLFPFFHSWWPGPSRDLKTFCGSWTNRQDLLLTVCGTAFC